MRNPFPDWTPELAAELQEVFHLNNPPVTPQYDGVQAVYGRLRELTEEMPAEKEKSKLVQIGAEAIAFCVMVILVVLIIAAGVKAIGWIIQL